MQIKQITVLFHPNVCVCLYLLHFEHRRMHCTTQMAIFSRNEEILAGSHKFQGPFEAQDGFLRFVLEMG